MSKRGNETEFYGQGKEGLAQINGYQLTYSPTILRSNRFNGYVNGEKLFTGTKLFVQSQLLQYARANKKTP